MNTRGRGRVDAQANSNMNPINNDSQDVFETFQQSLEYSADLDGGFFVPEPADVGSGFSSIIACNYDNGVMNLPPEKCSTRKKTSDVKWTATMKEKLVVAVLQEKVIFSCNTPELIVYRVVLQNQNSCTNTRVYE